MSMVSLEELAQACNSRFMTIGRETIGQPWVPGKSKEIFRARYLHSGRDLAYSAGYSPEVGEAMAYHAMEVLTLNGVPFREVP